MSDKEFIDMIFYGYKIGFFSSFFVFTIFNGKMFPDNINLVGRLVSIGGMAMFWPLLIMDFLYQMFKRK